MNWEQEFFNKMYNNTSQQKESKLSKDEKRYKWNCIIFEIATNWNEVRQLMKAKNKGTLKKLYKLDEQWIRFLDKNQIDIFEFNEDESEKFVELHYRTPK